MSETPKRRKRPVISLFSGAMGLDLGLEVAGLNIVVALECNSFPVATIVRNRPTLPLIDRPIEDVSSGEILEIAQLRSGEPFAVVGGPSCQVFSTAGQRQSLGDPRSTMFKHFVRVIRDTQPEFFVMENVRGLLSAAVRHRPLRQRGPGYPPLEEDEQLGSAFRQVAETLRDLGYYCVFDVLNAADYGVPQTRQRLVIVGSRDGKKVRMPRPTHDPEGTKGLQLTDHATPRYFESFDHRILWHMPNRRPARYSHRPQPKAKCAPTFVANAGSNHRGSDSR